MNRRIGRKAQERRRYHRYSTTSIAIKLNPAKDILISDMMSIVDFNRYGVALYTEHNFRVGETLCFTLSDESGRDVEVEGFVCNRSPSEQGYRFGLRFIETNDSVTPRTATLIEMEEALEALA